MSFTAPGQDSPDAPGPDSGLEAGASAQRTGGVIPDAANAPAFVFTAREPSAIPVLIAVPHAGRVYPPALVQRMRNPAYAALRLEDRYVDRLAHAIAAATGAALLVAQAPRAMIDLNRAADDIDWEMIAWSGPGQSPDQSQSPAKSPNSGPHVGRARSGLGLIPRRLPGIGELWKARHERAELDERIAGIHVPYHTTLADELARLRERWGAALLIDLHSMPPLVLRGTPAPEFVIGDRFGSTCSGALVAAAFAWLAQARRPAAHNRPYAGGYVLERHGRPRGGIHALQLEIDRSSYLDSRLAEPGSGFTGVSEVLSGLVRRLAGEVAELGRSARGLGWDEAAE
ncbi:MAG: N-formylglutamate amidohydrolase [Sphingomonadales bacterium]|nr:N-formylglutamate amidohydrolase [Sphingomonadales bacterium]MBU3993146.1 N-formylglutamate amidohydrolase [Alphaproteobacteria bacterium]